MGLRGAKGDRALLLRCLRASCTAHTHCSLLLSCLQRHHALQSLLLKCAMSLRTVYI